MKTKTILRIVFNSILIIVLTGILLSALGISALVSLFTDHTASSDSSNTSTHAVQSEGICDLDINWAAGTIILLTRADSDVISFSEFGTFSDKQAMDYSLEDHALCIDYTSTGAIWNMFSPTDKNLVITVPEGWNCRNLTINGADLEIEADHFIAENMELDGAGIELSYIGAICTFSCDGAGCDLDITLLNDPYTIDINGAGCEIDLQMPTSCGFQVETDGLGCSFRSNVGHSTDDGAYCFGNRNCEINVDGLGCSIAVCLSDSYD